MDVKVQIDAAKLLQAAEKAPAATLKEMRRALREACVAVQFTARTEHKFRAHTGALERAITYRVEQMKLEGIVFIDESVAKYGKYVHEPTGLFGPGHAKYPITPKHKKALRWTKNGEFVYFKRVMHPGSPEDRFLYKAVERNRARIDEIFERRTQAALEAAGLA